MTKPYLIAEIGGNHEGSARKAEELCRLAIASGADAIKFQLYRAGELVNPELSPDRHRHFKGFELSRAQHLKLAHMCQESGREYLASVWDQEMLEWIDPYLTRYKVGSGDLTAVPMLRALARRGKPIILSTGLAHFDEVAWAVELVRRANGDYSQAGMVTLLQCTSMYPIEESDANLAAMRTLANIPNVEVGYSDHTEGVEALVAATSMGATVLEFHFTDEREGQTFRDHKVSLTVDEVQELRRRIDRLASLSGSPEKRPLEIEKETGHVTSFRRGLFPARDMEAGSVIGPDDLLCLRPAEGIGAECFDALVGCTLQRPVKRLQKLDWSLVK